MTTQFNFNVCNAYYSKRTLPLYEYYYSIIHDRNDKMCLFGSNQHIDSHIPIIGICDTDDYLSAIDKTLNGILYHYENKTDFDFYFIGDDDTFINFNNYDKFLQLIKDSKTPCVYGSTGPTVYNTLHVTGGPGILLNRYSFDLVAPIIKERYIKDSSFSDVSLALNIDEYNKFAKTKIEFIEVPEFLNPHKELTDINKIITYHIRDKFSFKQLDSQICYSNL